MNVNWTAELATRAPRVLAAEDIAVNQFLLIAYLTQLGCPHEVVGTGRAAVERYFSGEYDIVLMDIRMPDMDGKAALAEIMARAPTGRPPIIAMTAHALLEEQAALLAFGFDGLLSKPFTMAELSDALRRAVDAETC